MLPDQEENGSPIGKRKESPIVRTQVGKEAKIHGRVSMSHCRTAGKICVWGSPFHLAYFQRATQSGLLPHSKAHYTPVIELCNTLP